MNNNLQILYRINSQDEIIFVNDEWSRFALNNDAPELVMEKVLNRNLWDFITGDTTQELYQKIVQKVRAGHIINFKFRGDSPDFRRLLGMNITLQEKNYVQFETRVVWIEKRLHQNILQRDVRPNERVLTVCSWCSKINVTDENWQEVEEAIINPGLFEMDALPRLSHGICFSCYQTISEKFQNHFAVNLQSK